MRRIVRLPTTKDRRIASNRPNIRSIQVVLNVVLTERRRIVRTSSARVVIFLAFGFLPVVSLADTVSLVNENFDGIGTSATATLPTNWKADKNATVQTLGTFAGAGTSTALRAGNNMSSSAGNGIYNFGAGDPAAASDRAVGFLSSGSGTASGNLYTVFQNSDVNAITSLNISSHVEKYRDGTNANGFSMQLLYSADGSTRMSAGAAFLTAFAADGDNSGFTPAPGTVVSIAGQTLNLSASPIAVGSSFYLAWNYSVTSGSTTTFAQALGIDNVVINGNAPALVPLPKSAWGGLAMIGWLGLVAGSKRLRSQPA